MLNEERKNSEYFSQIKEYNWGKEDIDAQISKTISVDLYQRSLFPLANVKLTFGRMRKEKFTVE